MGKYVPSKVRFIRRLRELLSRPGGWTKDAAARNASGHPVSHLDAGACSFCLSGAVRRIERYDSFGGMTANGVINMIIDYIQSDTGGKVTRIPAWNDDSERTQNDVIKMLDRLENAANT